LVEKPSYRRPHRVSTTDTPDFLTPTSIQALARYSLDSVAFRDRIPYVLDLLAGVTRSIDDESKGRRTPEFGMWWTQVDQTARQSIQEMRNAELKQMVSRTVQHYDTVMNAQAADYPNLVVNNGDTVTTVVWTFNEGELHGRPVLDTLQDYLRHVGDLVVEAERRLSQ
jgi:hypothetical protein